MPRRSRRHALAICLTLVAGGAPAFAATAGSDLAPAESTRPARASALHVQTVQTGLDIPWDLTFLSPTQYLLTERTGRLWLGSTVAATPLKRVAANLSDLTDTTEVGLLGIVADPAFAANRLFYTCQSHRSPSEMRVVRWRLSASGTQATRVGAPVIAGIPLGPMHAGCRVLVDGGGKLFVTTGDSADGRAPQNLDNLGGKILRVNRDGTIPSDNPYAASVTRKRRYVWNWGHRNPQGLAMRPGTAQMFSAEHGPDRDDEVNRVLRKRNYGWDPVFADGSPGYNQNVPMTNLVKFPNAIPAVWSSGFPTLAPSGIEFTSGRKWGTYDGALLMALLKDTGVLALTLDAAGNVVATAQVPELNDTYGRIRTIRRAPDGSLYVLTSNGGGTDVVLRVTPA